MAVYTQNPPLLLRNCAKHNIIHVRQFLHKSSTLHKIDTSQTWCKETPSQKYLSPFTFSYCVEEYVSLNTSTKLTHTHTRARARAFIIDDGNTRAKDILHHITYDFGRLIITSCHRYFEGLSPFSKPFRHSFESQPATYLHTHIPLFPPRILY